MQPQHCKTTPLAASLTQGNPCALNNAQSSSQTQQMCSTMTTPVNRRPSCCNLSKTTTNLSRCTGNSPKMVKMF